MKPEDITIKSVIVRAGGPAAFARATGYPLGTIKSWLYGTRTPRNAKLAGLLADGLFHRRYCGTRPRPLLPSSK